MSRSDHRDSSPPELLSRLIEIARQRADDVALRHKRRGAWWAWSWRDIVTLTDRIASSFRAAGIGEGATIALSGEIAPNLLLATLAARLVGAQVLSVPPHATRERIVALLRASPVALVVVQGSESLAAWLEAKQAVQSSILIVFDHAADARQSAALLPVAALLDHAAEHGWAEAFGQGAPKHRRPPKSDRRSTVWVEAATDWSEGAVAITDRWLASGDILALPEGLAASARDRLDVRPDRWILSTRHATAVAGEIADRLPLDNDVAHRFVAPVFEGTLTSRSPSSRLARWLLRRRLGLDRLSAIDIGHGPPLDEQTDRIFAGLGLALHALTPPPAEAKARPTRPVLQLVLTEDTP